MKRWSHRDAISGASTPSARSFDNSALAREAARDPKASAEARGIAIPANMTVELDIDDDGQISLRVTHYDELAPFALTWDRDGFSATRLDPQLADHVAEQPT
jgi:hypothetical protein